MSATIIDEISAERQRQIKVEGWTLEHDDDHDEGELALAAVCYASPTCVYRKEDYADGFRFCDPWPFGEDWDKRKYNGNVLVSPTSYPIGFRRRCLVKAAALIVAEIERLDRILDTSKRKALATRIARARGAQP